MSGTENGRNGVVGDGNGSDEGNDQGGGDDRRRGPAIDVGAVVDAVRADVAEGLDGVLAPDGDGEPFGLLGPFADRGALVDPPYVVVQWVHRGRDSASGLNGMHPSHKPIEVRGLTVVDTSGGTWLFHRHIDWNSVNSQLGGSRGRTSTSVAPTKGT